MKMVNVSRLVKPVFAALITFYALFTDAWGKVPVESMELSVLFIGITAFYYHHLGSCQKDRRIVAFSSFFSLCMVIGRAYDKKDTFFILLSGKHEILVSLLSFIGFFILFYVCLCQLEKAIMQVGLGNETQQFTGKQKLKYAGIILMCWLPVLIAFFPGSVDHDSFAMLDFWIGYYHWTTHHPVVATVYLGMFMDFGKYLLHHVNAGVFLYISIQIAFGLWVIMKMIELMRKLGTPRPGVYAALAFFALMPVWPGYMQCVIKDSMHFIFYMLYSVFLVEILLEPHWIQQRKHWGLLLFAALGMFSFRNTGIYLFVLTFIPLTIYLLHKSRALWKPYVSVCTVVLVVHFAFAGILVPALGIKKGGVQEMLSIPFQQTARYVKYHPRDILPWEREAVNGVLPIDKIPKAYDSQISDPVKSMIKKDGKSKLPAYFKAWFSMGLRHPGIYLDALGSGTYDYFYPDGFSRARKVGLKLYIKDKHDKNSPNTGIYDVQYMQSASLRKKVIYYLTTFWREIPIMGLCFNTGVYTWICMICAMLLLGKRKFSALLALLPSAVTLLFCIASPVNGYVRYMLPIMATVPLMISWALYCLHHKKVKQT